VIDLCNQEKLSPADFLVHEGSVRVKPERFAVVIGWREVGWWNRQRSRTTEQTVDASLQHIRRLARTWRGAGLDRNVAQNASIGS
jgi:hypothetical protein